MDLNYNLKIPPNHKISVKTIQSNIPQLILHINPYFLQQAISKFALRIFSNNNKNNKNNRQKLRFRNKNSNRKKNSKNRKTNKKKNRSLNRLMSVFYSILRKFPGLIKYLRKSNILNTGNFFNRFYQDFLSFIFLYRSALIFST